MGVTLMDCTLRDGGNILGKGFDAEITDMVLDGLTACHVPVIEFGNSGGIGAYEVAGFTAALRDQEYLDIAGKYRNRGSELGMFLNAKRFREKNVELAKENGLSFLRVGADAGELEVSIPPIKAIRQHGMLDFIDKRLQPAMAARGYHNAISPLDLTLGISGCHSSFTKKMKEVAEEKGVNLFRLIVEVSKVNRKNPSEELMRSVAEQLM